MKKIEDKKNELKMDIFLGDVKKLKCKHAEKKKKWDEKENEFSEGDFHSNASNLRTILIHSFYIFSVLCSTRRSREFNFKCLIFLSFFTHSFSSSPPPSHPLCENFCWRLTRNFILPFFCILLNSQTMFSPWGFHKWL